MTVLPSSTSTAVAHEADAIAAAVIRCPGVGGLHAGGWRQVATYLPGRRVTGVRVDEARILVSVVLAYGVPVSLMAAEVRAALAPIAGGRPIDVQVADVVGLPLPFLPAEDQLVPVEVR